MERASPYSAGIVDAAELADDEAWQVDIFSFFQKKKLNSFYVKLLIISYSNTTIKSNNQYLFIKTVGV